jgi:Ca2+-binding RTX toxin-like protein
VLGLAGRDKLYGSGGADRISAGADRDYVDGGAGDDILTGGLGDDTVYGLMLAALDKGHADTEGGWGPWHHDGDSLTIREYSNPQDPNNSTAVHSGRSNVINYNPHLDNLTLNHGASTVDGPPSVVLYHEMAHVYDYVNDSLAPGGYQGPDNPDTPNREREAAGLPLDDGKIYDKHPYDLTENGLRDEMGAPNRVPAYGAAGTLTPDPNPAYVTGGDDDEAVISKRVFPRPDTDKVNWATTPLTYGVIVAPGASVAEDFTVPLPLTRRHPYGDDFGDGTIKLPDLSGTAPVKL